MEKVKHLIDTRQCKDKKFLAALYGSVDELRSRLSKERIMDHNGKILASWFYEPSTRTQSSFDAAAIRLGASVIGTENGGEFSSAVKGETLEHSIRATSENYDVIVLRHKESGAAERAAKVSKKPVINAGDGNNQHPTQSLLDVYTIAKEFGRVEGLRVAMLGDLKNGRTVRSLAYLLAHLNGNQLTFVSPPSISMDDGILSYLKEKGIQYSVSHDLEEVLPQIDVLYATRIQQERLRDSPEQYKEITETYDRFRITKERADMMRGKSIIMHPLPINTTKQNKPEVDPEVDNHPRARYFQQSSYGVYVRMGVLDMMFRREESDAYNFLLPAPSLT